MGSYQVEANRRWREKNPEHNRYLRNRTNARTFVRLYAQPEDLDELEGMIYEKRRKFNSGEIKPTRFGGIE